MKSINPLWYDDNLVRQIVINRNTARRYVPFMFIKLISYLHQTGPAAAHPAA